MLRVIAVEGIVAITHIAEHVACVYVRFTVSNRFAERKNTRQQESETTGDPPTTKSGI